MNPAEPPRGTSCAVLTACVVLCAFGVLATTVKPLRLDQIRDRAGAVIGAISVSMPKMRATEEHMALARQEIMAAARALSEEYGAPAPAEGSKAAEKHLKILEA